jgi:hypothetical protein
MLLSHVSSLVKDIGHLYLLRVEHTGVDQKLIFDLDVPIVKGW